MTSDKAARPEALVTLSEMVATADGPLPADEALPRLRELADQLGEDDGFGFAVVAYHALTGADPFPAADRAPRPVADVAPGFPSDAADVLMRALAPTPSTRPSPGSVVAVLEEQLSPQDPSQQTPSPQTPSPQSREDFRRAIRDVVAPPQEVPRIAALEHAGALPEALWDPDLPSRPHRERKRSSRRRTSSGDDLRATLVIVAAIVAVALLGLLYALLR